MTGIGVTITPCGPFLEVFRVIKKELVDQFEFNPANASPATRRPAIVIQPSHGWSSLGLRDIWEYRELLFYLIWREIQGAYRQTALGLSWYFLRPIVNMLLLTFVFGRVVNVPSDGVPYPLFSLAALLPWGFFSNAVLRASRSLVDNMNVISKVYFPRMIIPIASAASELVRLWSCLFSVGGNVVAVQYALALGDALVALFTV